MILDFHLQKWNSQKKSPAGKCINLIGNFLAHKKDEGAIYSKDKIKL